MRKVFLFGVLTTLSFMAKAQNLEALLLASDDSNTLAKYYFEPMFNGLQSSINSGWYHSAKTHKKFGFDVSFGAGAAFSPSNVNFFEFIPSEYNYLSLSGNDTQLPTVISTDSRQTDFEVSIPYLDNQYKVAGFSMPGGIGDDLPLGAVPSPFIQVGVGLFFKTDLKIRYIPNTNFDSRVASNFIGIGIQHDLMQYIGVLDKLPLNMSFLATYSKSDLRYSLGKQNPSSQVSFSNASMAFALNSWTTQLVASLDLPLISFYGALGFSSSNAAVSLKGNYQVNYDVEDSSGNTVSSVSESLVDPLSIRYDSSGTRLTMGARLNLLFFKVFTDYTIQEYNTLNVGFAFSFR